jgi:hypothetical protein
MEAGTRAEEADTLAEGVDTRVVEDVSFSSSCYVLVFGCVLISVNPSQMALVEEEAADVSCLPFFAVGCPLV